MTRRHLVIGLATIIAFPTVPAFAGRRHAAAAKKFLGSIYQRYLVKSSIPAAGVSLTDAESVRSYFTPGLASLILEDRAALNGDPFIGRLEWDISDLSIDVKDTAPKSVGTVTFMNFGKPEKIVLELLLSGNEWRVADVEWNSGTLRGLYRGRAAYDGETVH